MTLSSSSPMAVRSARTGGQIGRNVEVDGETAHVSSCAEKPRGLVDEAVHLERLEVVASVTSVIRE
jgi:hypothetical protein